VNTIQARQDRLRTFNWDEVIVKGALIIFQSNDAWVNQIGHRVRHIIKEILFREEGIFLGKIAFVNSLSPSIRYTL
jgi:hypothetical protein